MRIRNVLLAMHRWVGLVLAGFLMLAGITGALLVWNHELDAALIRLAMSGVRET